MCILWWGNLLIMYIIRGNIPYNGGVPDYIPASFAEAVVYHISELQGQHT